MKQYVMGLFVMALCCCIVELIGAKGAIGRHLKLMSALCLLCVLISPLTQLISRGASLPDVLTDALDGWLETSEQKKEEYTERWEQESERLDLDYAQSTVASMLAEQFSIQEKECRVEIVLRSDETVIERIRVALSGRGIWVNTHQMQSYIKETFGCESTIYIE